jgi:outer membrane protein OmpA-like peptidoglycan-associated protein
MEPPPPAIHFARGTRALDRKSKPVVDAVRDILRTHPEIKKIAVRGHAATDEPGAKKLSEARAEAVVRALVEAGIDHARLVTEPHGSEMPIVPNDTTANRNLNRRVDFYVLDRSESCAAPGAPASP